MDDSSPPPFQPVPVRSRSDGWTSERQRAFIAFIPAGLRPGCAAARVGMRRQGAYALRQRPGAEGFTAAWDSAAEEASRERAAVRSGAGLYPRAVEGIAVPIRHRRRIVAVERRYDNAALIRLLQILDRNQRNAMNGGPGLFSLMDPETLSAFAPTATLDLGDEIGGPDSIGGGGTAAHPLEDVASSELPET